MASRRGVAVLSRVEEILLLVAWEQKGKGYGVSIRERVQQLLGRRVSAGAVYVPLGRLVQQGLLRATLGEPTRVRGGRRKRFYRVTAPRGRGARGGGGGGRRARARVPQPGGE